MTLFSSSTRTLAPFFLLAAAINFWPGSPAVAPAEAQWSNTPNPTTFFQYIRRVAYANKIDANLGKYQREAMPRGRAQIELYRNGNTPVALLQPLFNRQGQYGTRTYYFENGQLYYVIDDKGRYGFSGSNLVFWFAAKGGPANTTRNEFYNRQDFLYDESNRLLTAFEHGAERPGRPGIPDYNRFRYREFVEQTEEIDRGLNRFQKKAIPAPDGGQMTLWLERGVPRLAIAPLTGDRAPRNARRYYYFNRRGELFFVRDFRGESGFNDERMLFWVDNRRPVEPNQNRWERRESNLVASAQSVLDAFASYVPPEAPGAGRDVVSQRYDYMQRIDNRLSRFEKFESPRRRTSVVLYAKNGEPRKLIEPVFDRSSRTLRERSYYYRNNDLFVVADDSGVMGFDQGKMIFWNDGNGNPRKMSKWQWNLKQQQLIRESVDLLEEVSLAGDGNRPRFPDRDPRPRPEPPVEQRGNDPFRHLHGQPKHIIDRVKYAINNSAPDMGRRQGIEEKVVQLGNRRYVYYKSVVVNRVLRIDEFERHRGSWDLVNQSFWRDNKLWAVGDAEKWILVYDRNPAAWVHPQSLRLLTVPRNRFFNESRAMISAAMESRKIVRY